MNERDPYGATGVDYGVLDAAKLVAQAAAKKTSPLPRRLGVELDDASRGEPATVISVGSLRLGFVLECLGTKSMIARAYEDETGVDRFEAIGYDTVAAAVNDCCCVGALPFVVNAYFATGAASFYEGSRHHSLVAGFARACEDAGAAWGGGESPTLSGLVVEDEIDLAASAVGIVPALVEPLLGDALEEGDEIVLVSSSGLHANGASLARNVADELGDGWATPLSSGEAFGEAMLTPALLYSPLVEAALGANLPVHYASHVTGHGLRKLMRANRRLTYRIEALPKVPESLRFLSEKAGLSDKEAYGTLNMGVGFALYVANGAGQDLVALAESLGQAALVGGRVQSGPRRVVLEPVEVSFEDDELTLR